LLFTELKTQNNEISAEKHRLLICSAPDLWSIESGARVILPTSVVCLTRWTWDQSLLTVEINTITRWAVKELPNV